MNKSFLEENLRQLSEKECFYCSLSKEEFLGSISEDINRKAASDNLDTDSVAVHSVVFLANEQNMDRILELERLSDAYQGKAKGKYQGIPMLPFYLYYEEEQFIQFVRRNDITPLCQRYRIVILVGEEELENYFCNLDVIFPDVIAGGTGGVFGKKLSVMMAEKQNLLKELMADVYLYYRDNGEAIRERVLNGTARICILKYYYECDGFQEFYREFKRFMEKRGMSITICDERGPIFVTSEIVNLYQYKPDIIFQINKTRYNTWKGETFQFLINMKNLIVVSWIQDLYPTIISKKCAVQMMDTDFIFSIFDENIMKKYGYSDYNVIYRAIMPSDREDFFIRDITRQEHEYYDCDLCFMGSIFDEEKMLQFTYEVLGICMERECIDVAWDIMREILIKGNYDEHTQKYIVGSKVLNQCINQICERLQCDEEKRLYVYRVCSSIGYHAFRRLILQQLAACGKYKIIVYGSYLDIEGIEYRAWIKNRSEVSKAVQCSKILLQVNPEVTINKRVAEGLLCHVPVLVYKVEQEEDMSCISHYLQEGEGFWFFEDRQELLKKCDLLLFDEALREEVAERGYQKACQTLTTDAVFGHMLDSLKVKIKGE